MTVALRYRVVLLLAGLALAIVPVRATRQQQDPPPAVGGITGVVRDAVTGAVLVGARVSVRHAESIGGPAQRVVTDSKGRFAFALPPATDYFIDASRFGYAATRYGWTAPGQSFGLESMRRIPVSAGQLVADIDVPLWRLGTISGRVLDEANEPMVGVVVRAFTMANIAGLPQPVAGALATTDDRGVYRLSDIAPGRYVVGVLSVQSTVLASTPEGPQLRPVGELASGGIGGGRGAIITSPTIDVDGDHRLALSNFATPPPPNRGDARAYPAVYYPAAPNPADATPFEIHYGDSRAGVDFQIQPMRAVRISGRIDAGALPTPRLLLRLLPKGSEQLGFGAEAATTEIESNGAFTFLNVPAGEYTLMAQGTVMDFYATDQDGRLPDAPGFPAGGISVGSKPSAPSLNYLVRAGQAETAWGRMAISVGGSNIDGLVFPMHAAGKIRGRVTFADGVKVPTSPFLLFAQPANGDPSLGNPSTRTAQGDSTFSFELSGLLPGTYLLDPLSFGGMAPISVMWDGHEMKDTGFDATQGRDFDNVVLTLTNNFAEVTGVVSDANGPTGGAVLVFPAERERWSNFGWTPLRLQSTPAAANGTYRARRLPEGDYLMVAVDATKSNEWVNPKFLAAAAPFAKKVSVKWGDKVVVDLPISDVVIK